MGGMRGAELYMHTSRRSKGGGSRLRHKRREAWRRGPFTERGRGVVFKAPTPHPVIMGSGRLEDHTSAPFSKWVAPPCHPPFMGKARTTPLLGCDACLREPTPRMPPTSHAPPHAAPRAGIVGSAAHKESYRGKKCPACPRTVFGPSPTTRLRLRVAQARGLLSVYRKRGTLFVPL